MTRRKHESRRLGFGEDHYRSANDIQEFARWIFLQTVARVEPQVLTTLDAIRAGADGGPERVELDLWAERWNLTAAWCRAYAENTWRMWRTLKGCPRCWFDRAGLAGELVSNKNIEPPPRPLKNPLHFEWLARLQLSDASLTAIATAAGTTAPVVHEACKVLAKLLDIETRRNRRGRPRNPIS